MCYWTTKFASSLANVGPSPPVCESGQATELPAAQGHCYNVHVRSVNVFKF